MSVFVYTFFSHLQAYIQSGTNGSHAIGSALELSSFPALSGEPSLCFSNFLFALCWRHLAFMFVWMIDFHHFDSSDGSHGYKYFTCTTFEMRGRVMHALA